jgi:hypothetical protein
MTIQLAGALTPALSLAYSTPTPNGNAREPTHEVVDGTCPLLAYSAQSPTPVHRAHLSRRASFLAVVPRVESGALVGSQPHPGTVMAIQLAGALTPALSLAYSTPTPNGNALVDRRGLHPLQVVRALRSAAGRAHMSASAREVLTVLALRADPDGRVQQLGQARIAEESHRCERTVRTALEQLRRVGLVNTRRSGPRGALVYLLASPQLQDLDTPTASKLASSRPAAPGAQTGNAPLEPAPSPPRAPDRQTGNDPTTRPATPHATRPPQPPGSPRGPGALAGARPATDPPLAGARPATEVADKGTGEEKPRTRAHTRTREQTGNVLPTGSVPDLVEAPPRTRAERAALNHRLWWARQGLSLPFPAPQPAAPSSNGPPLGTRPADRQPPDARRADLLTDADRQAIVAPVRTWLDERDPTRRRRPG